MATKKQFVASIGNPLELVKLIGHLGHQDNYFDRYLREELKAIRQSKDLAIKVVGNFQIFAKRYQITSEHFKKSNTTRITEREFKILTDPHSLKLEEEQGGPDDIYPWDIFCIIDDWKILLLAAMFSSLCHGISIGSILQGHNVPYLMKQCARDCSTKNCPISAQIN